MKKLLLLTLSGCGLISGVDEYSTTPDAGDAAVLEAAVDGGVEAANDAPVCTCGVDLSDVGLGDFAIAFTITTAMHPTVPGYGALLNQQKSCDSAHPGWHVWLNSGAGDGTVEVQLFDGNGTQIDDAMSGSAVNDGMPHRMVIARSHEARALFLTVDGVTKLVPIQAEALTGVLAPLQIGADPVCMGNMAAPPQPFVGTITDLCISKGCISE